MVSGLDPLDQLRALCTPQTDVELSFLIRVSPAMISQIRTGRREPPFDLKVMLLEKLGYVFDHDLLIRLLPMSQRKVICASMMKNDTSSVIDLKSQNIGKDLPPLTDENPLGDSEDRSL